jgi:serine/threonine-protein kinase ULK4
MNKYHIYEEEARGKYSVIFKARRKKRLEFVAIKRMDKARKQKILNEAKILEELHHNNIIKFYEHMETKNHMWAVTEYCPGGDLLKLIEQDKSLPEPVVKGFAVEVMRALAYAHSKGVVVCDLKPATILIN